MIQGPTCPWEPIHGFQSWSEYSRFRTWMDDQLKSELALETIVQSYYSGIHGVERWFGHVASREIWRLVQPAAPFKGVFERVPLDEQVQVKEVPFGNQDSETSD